MSIHTSRHRRLPNVTFGSGILKMSESASLRPSHDHTLLVALTTTVALIDQFAASLSQPGVQPEQCSQAPTPPPLPLLSASAMSLKAQSTKLSLLTLTPPFTPSAVSTVLSALNSSVLPSLLTAALLATNEETKYTASFSAEVSSIINATLRDLHTLISCVEKRSRHGDPKDPLDEQQKSSVTEAVGRVWESCDELVALANGGIGAFVVKRAEMWLGLIKDAVEELQDWDPEEDGVDGLFGEDALQDENERGDAGEDAGAAEKAKASAMKVLTRVPQSIHVVVKQRLRKLKWDPDGKDLSGEKPNNLRAPSASDLEEGPLEEQGALVDQVLKELKQVSESIDETAEALYMGELNRSSRLVKEVWKATVNVVEIVKRGRNDQARHGIGDVVEGRTATNEDKYIRRALDWIRLVEPKPLSSRATINGPTQEVEGG